MPHATSNVPAILPSHNPLGVTFSTSTGLTATHHMFITPATDSNHGILVPNPVSRLLSGNLCC
jgi:hypothetical protein